jgi:SAM-dependent methyltransferase
MNWLASRGMERTSVLKQAAALLADDPEVVETVSPEDTMLRDTGEMYFPLGALALRKIRLAMLAGRCWGAQSILDFGCGYGRVLRYLAAGFPRAELAACDLDRGGVDFCADTFGATPIYGSYDPAEIEVGETFDLIWCGSVFTHLDAPRWNGFLDLLTPLLRPRGLLVFTTTGHGYLESVRRGDGGNWFPLEQAGDFPTAGFAYAEYPHIPGYGQFLCSVPWALEKLERLPLRVVMATEDCWAHQDVIACVRA